jgi:hypothetical protein
LMQPNRWVVPYNPYLCAKFNAHINVEICSHVGVVKCLYKYVYKGHDRAALEVSRADGEAIQEQDVDEIKQFLDSRYISCSEVAWRIFRFPIHAENPNVVRLAIHLEGEQTVLVRDTATVAEQVDAGPPKSTLTQYFELNRRLKSADPHHPHLSLIYPDVVEKYSWNKNDKEWWQRERTATRTLVGRMYFVQPSEGERFYLRLLLHNVAGATSFEDLRTTGRDTDAPVVHPTFRAACQALGLLRDDSEWQHCMTEAASVSCVMSHCVTYMH